MLAPTPRRLPLNTRFTIQPTRKNPSALESPPTERHRPNCHTRSPQSASGLPTGVTPPTRPHEKSRLGGDPVFPDVHVTPQLVSISTMPFRGCLREHRRHTTALHGRTKKIEAIHRAPGAGAVAGRHRTRAPGYGRPTPRPAARSQRRHPAHQTLCCPRPCPALTPLESRATRRPGSPHRGRSATTMSLSR
jgi:hypothetical protein